MKTQMNGRFPMLCLAASLAAALLLVASPAALAHGDAHKGHASGGKRPISTEEHAWGREGDPAKATRTVRIDMADTMRFTPPLVEVKRGETIRFEVRNRGKVMHEMVIGTEAELKKHAEVMKKHPNMEHDEPYMAHVGPGKTGRVVWQFTNAGEYWFGCLIPGHYEAGMVGRVIVK